MLKISKYVFYFSTDRVFFNINILIFKVTSWRYQRGARILTINVEGDGTHKSKEKQDTDIIEDEEEYDVPEQMEEIIEELLNGLKDPDTFVRWMAAKG